MRPVDQTPSDQLSMLVAQHMSTPGHLPDSKPETDFVMSGLRAAYRAAPKTRQKILSDISDVLNCEASDLDFLFMQFQMPQINVVTYEVMVPDFHTMLLAAAE